MNTRAVVLACSAAFTALVLSCAGEPKRAEGNQPPIPVLAAPDSAAVGDSVTISIKDSHDFEGIIADRQILFGDGTGPAVGYGTIDHVYEAPGLYLIEAYIKDEDGAPARARRRIVITDDGSAP